MEEDPQYLNAHNSILKLCFQDKHVVSLLLFTLRKFGLMLLHAGCEVIQTQKNGIVHDSR